MKVAVIVATYCRKNGTSPHILNKMFQNLLRQTHKNFKVFIVGDDYTKRLEFLTIINKYKNKLNIWSMNNKKSLRTSTFKIQQNLWTSGGVYAKYEAIKQAIKEKYNIYMHLDDDDIWRPNHIKNYVKTFRQFPQVDFVYSKAKYYNMHLPRNVPRNLKVRWKNFPRGLRPCNIVHSTFAFNLNKTKHLVLKMFRDRIRLIEQIKTKKIKEIKIRPHDAQQLYTLRQFKKSSICIPQVTCIKPTDRNIPVV